MISNCGTFVVFPRYMDIGAWEVYIRNGIDEEAKHNLYEWSIVKYAHDGAYGTYMTLFS
jgi:hypothetical protein